MFKKGTYIYGSDWVVILVSIYLTDEECFKHADWLARKWLASTSDLQAAEETKSRVNNLILDHFLVYTPFFLFLYSTYRKNLTSVPVKVGNKSEHPVKRARSIRLQSIARAKLKLSLHRPNCSVTFTGTSLYLFFANWKWNFGRSELASNKRRAKQRFVNIPSAVIYVITTCAETKILREKTKLTVRVLKVFTLS